MGIRTGYETGKGQGPSAGFRPQPGVTANILFSPDSPAGERFSARVDILPGNAYLVSAYNLPSDRRVFLNQISTGTLPGREKADQNATKGRAAGAVPVKKPVQKLV